MYSRPGAGKERRLGGAVEHPQWLIGEDPMRIEPLWQNPPILPDGCECAFELQGTRPGESALPTLATRMSDQRDI